MPRKSVKNQRDKPLKRLKKKFKFECSPTPLKPGIGSAPSPGFPDNRLPAFPGSWEKYYLIIHGYLFKIHIYFFKTKRVQGQENLLGNCVFDWEKKIGYDKKIKGENRVRVVIF